MPADLTPQEERLFAARAAAEEFAKKCRVVEEHAPSTEEATLDSLVNYLMTEFWDNGFSTAEIRAAFEAAAKDVSRYAGLDKRNGTGIRGTKLR